MIVLDDLAHHVGKSDTVELMFTQMTHHYNLTAIFIRQNLFHKSMRTVTLNAHYMVIFHSLRDGMQVKCLARQIYPTQSDCFMKAYDDATKLRYGYLLVNMSPHTSHETLRLFTNIFDKDITVYKCI